MPRFSLPGFLMDWAGAFFCFPREFASFATESAQSCDKVRGTAAHGTESDIQGRVHRMKNIKTFGRSLVIGFALYPVIFLGIIALVALQVFAEQLHYSADTVPLLYGLVFAALTIVLIDLMELASVVMALIASANLIEYAQMVIPGRNASAVDFIAGLSGVIVAALLVWIAHSVSNRSRATRLPDEPTESAASVTRSG